MSCVATTGLLDGSLPLTILTEPNENSNPRTSRSNTCSSKLQGYDIYVAGTCRNRTYQTPCGVLSGFEDRANHQIRTFPCASEGLFCMFCFNPVVGPHLERQEPLSQSLTFRPCPPFLDPV